MIKDQCISVTDLRTKTKICLDGIDKHPKYIFINNKPIAVLINITDYETNFLKPELIELEKNEVDAELIKEAVKVKKIGKKDLINI
ncbi:MAG: hypothetical protein WC806_06150 [Candidatus Gracilibacteria bacterium]|jgi:hypothetical protein